MAARQRRKAARAPRREGGGRSLAVVLGAVVLGSAGVGAYFAARETSLFALQRIEVEGASPKVAADIRETLRPFVGESLVSFDRAVAARRLSTLSEISGAHFDRDFPHTLRVRVSLERPVAVLRRGADAWLVSASARVLRQLEQRPYPRLPRIWVPRTADVAVNATLGGAGAKGVAAVAPLSPLRVRADVRQVLAGDDELTLVLASGTELRLGDPGDIRLKLAVAGRILPLTEGARYVDISVPERPVAGYNPQVVG